MAGISSRTSETLASMGFNGLGNKNPFVENPSNFGYPDIESSFPDKSVPLSKLIYNQFDAVVDQQGGGTHLTIQDAINDINAAGGGTIKINNGTYFLNDDITLYSNISLIGEDKYNTIIDFGDNNYQLLISGGSFYGIGYEGVVSTIAVTNGSPNVVGTDNEQGCNWLTTLSVGDSIIIKSDVYTILSITDDNNLVLDRNYNYLTESGLYYYTGAFKTNIDLSNLTIKSSSGTANLYIANTVNSSFENLILKDGSIGDNTNGIYASFVWHSSFKRIKVTNNYQGVSMSSMYYCSFENFFANGNNYIGLFFGNVSVLFYCDFNKIYSINNNSGISTHGVSCNFNNIFCIENRTHGFLTYSDNNHFNNIQCIKNGREGILVYGSSYNQFNNIKCLNNSQLTNNTYEEILLRSTSIYNQFNNVLTKSDLTNKANYGIAEATSADDYNIYNNINIFGAATSSLDLNGANSQLGLNNT